MLYFVTSNLNKLQEIEALLGISLKNIKLELPEIQGSFPEVAAAKALAACKQLGKGARVFVEDSGICFDALGDLPGPYTKSFLQKLGPNSLFALLEAFNNKKAKAASIIAYCEPGKKPKIFKGIAEGLAVQPRGNLGFGWDSIFQPKGHNKTFAEMTFEEKNKISHRTKALLQFKDFLETLG